MDVIDSPRRWGEENDEEERMGTVISVGVRLCTYILLPLSNTVDLGS